MRPVDRGLYCLLFRARSARWPEMGWVRLVQEGGTWHLSVVDAHWNLVVLSKHQLVLCVDWMSHVHVVGRVHLVWLWAFRDSKGAEVVSRRPWSPSFVREVGGFHVLWSHRRLVSHGRAGLAGLAVHLEWGPLRLVIHLGAPWGSGLLSPWCAWGRGVLGHQFGSLVQRGRSRNRDGGQEIRIALAL